MRLSTRAEAILAGESSSARCWTVEHEIQVGRVFGAACPSASTGAKSQSPTVRGVIVPYPSRRSRTPLLTRLWVLVNVPVRKHSAPWSTKQQAGRTAMSNPSESQVALITGAGRGIGRAIAYAYARAGIAYHLTELETRRRWQIPMVTVISNSSGFGQGVCKRSTG